MKILHQLKKNFPITRRTTTAGRTTATRRTSRARPTSTTRRTTGQTSNVHHTWDGGCTPGLIVNDKFPNFPNRVIGNRYYKF